uniref:Uncharacterized protein n=1 Tax=Guillardia theta TaxID=55529 RepID=A0A7S4NCY0_GUITH
MFEALFNPEKVSMATRARKRELEKKFGSKGYIESLPEADYMDVVLLPLALLPGRMGETARMRVAQGVVNTFQQLLTLWSWAVTRVQSFIQHPQLPGRLV